MKGCGLKWWWGMCEGKGKQGKGDCEGRKVGGERELWSVGMMKCWSWGVGGFVVM